MIKNREYFDIKFVVKILNPPKKMEEVFITAVIHCYLVEQYKLSDEEICEFMNQKIQPSKKVIEKFKTILPKIVNIVKI